MYVQLIERNAKKYLYKPHYNSKGLNVNNDCRLFDYISLNFVIIITEHSLKAYITWLLRTHVSLVITCTFDDQYVVDKIFLKQFAIFWFVCWQYFNEIHSTVIQFAFGNPTGSTVNWFYICTLYNCVLCNHCIM